MDTENPQFARSSRSGIGTGPLIFALFCLGAVAACIWIIDRREIGAMSADREQMAANLNHQVQELSNRMVQSQSQVQELSNRLDALTIAQERAQAAADSPSHAGKKTPARRGGKDPRVDKLQGQLSDTQQELARANEHISKTRDELNGSIAKTREDLNGSIAQTRDELARSREELSGQINSTRSDLDGSIARTHEEVVALRKRGEQNIYEFQIDKSKEFQRLGPLSVALRSTNPKRKTYDLSMIVEDNQISKNHVNLYEPILIRLRDLPQAAELVVNRIDKDRITGYLSEPKYKRGQLKS